MVSPSAWEREANGALTRRSVRRCRLGPRELGPVLRGQRARDRQRHHHVLLHPPAHGGRDDEGGRRGAPSDLVRGLSNPPV